jgi:ligand-binding sensor domain-containing protein/two-component sensor histidine kinase
MPLRKSACIYLLFFLIICLNANTFVRAQSYNFQYFTVENGLSQSEVTFIYEDSRGFIWLGTAGGGINMFDGKEFISYEEKDGLSGNIITCLSEDINGNLWIGTTWGGVNKFNGRSFKYFNMESGLSNNYIRTIATDNEGKVWIGTNKGINIFNGVDLKFIDSKTDIPCGEVNYIFKDLSGRIWIGGKEGIAYFENNKFTAIDLQKNNINSEVLFFDQDVEGNIWFYTSENKLYYYTKTGEILSFAYNYLLNKSNISSIKNDNEGNLWIATSDFWLIKYHQNEVEIFTPDNGLPKTSIISMYKDRSGNLWLGTQGYGLVKYTNTPFNYYDNFEGLNSPTIFSIAEDSKNNLWIGSVTDGLTMFDGKKTKKWTTNEGLPSQTIYGLSIDINDNIWIATKNGLSRFNGKTFTTYTTKDGLPTNRIRSVFCDKKGKVLIGTSGMGLYSFNGKTIEKIFDKEGLGTQSVHCIFEDKIGNIWCGTGSGAYKLSENTVQKYGVEQGLCNSYIGTITQDNSGRIWFATDRCIASFDGIKIKTYDQKNGLTSNTIYLIQFDNEDNLWVGTNKGLDKVSFATYGQIKNIKNYSKAEGFNGIECNARSVLKDKLGNLYFGTVKGLIKYNPELDVPDMVEPDLHITNINLYYESTDWANYAKKLTRWFQLPENLNLPYDKNHLTFEFKAITKTSPEKTLYSFKLEGYDEKWSPYTAQTKVTYPKLPPGKYTFSVNACNSSGICTKGATSFTFKIDAPFWKTYWFIILVITLITFVIIRIIKYRETKQEQAKKELEEIVSQRTQEIKKQKEQIEILLKEIHHRVKNNLQIINSLINLQSGYVEDENVQELFKEARNRIITMALIHEKLYESKDLSNINLKAYFDKLLEYLKSSYELKYNITFEKNIEPLQLNIDTVIPLGILLNEIISNSLKYGFDDNTQSPTISISITQREDGTYLMLAGDNGNGFDKNVFTNNTTTLGLELIKMLSEQLNGTVELLDKKGTWYKIEFKGIH